MKNTFGNSITVTIFGESHKDAIGCVIDGIAPGIEINEEYIQNKLYQRQAGDAVSTPRKEDDTVEFLSGVSGGVTEGTPILLLIKNSNKKSSAYSPYENTPRPSHADFSAECKFHGYQDKRGGGHFSGRITASLVAAGAILSYALLKKGIHIGTHIKTLHGVHDRAFENLESDIDFLSREKFPVLSEAKREEMISEILSAKACGDSVGGVLETAITGIPTGVGEPFFDTVESYLSHILFAIPAVKGVEFGDGFALADMFGSEANDPLAISDGKVITSKNSSGGIVGGITNGMPIIFRCAVKPTPSISKEQKTVNLKEMKECNISVTGRHDPCIVHRARAVVDAAAAIAIADLLALRYGTDYLSEEA